MSNSRKSPLYFFLAGIFSLLLLWLALRGVSWKEFLHTLQGIQSQYLVLAVLISILSIFTRSVRWGTLVRAEKPVSTLTMFWAITAGYLGNNLLPARIGDLLRSVLLGRRTGISAAFVLATTLTERILDVLALLIIGSSMLLTVPGLPTWLPSAMRVMAVLGLVGIVLLLSLPLYEKILQSWLLRMPMPPHWLSMLSCLLEQFTQGARSFVHPGRAAIFTLLTGLIWLLDAFGTTVLARGLHLSLTIPQALLLLVGLGLSSAVPSTPGYIGVYQFVAVTILPVFTFSRSQAIAYIVLQQTITLLIVLAFGLIGLWRLGGSPRRALQAVEHQYPVT